MAISTTKRAPYYARLPNADLPRRNDLDGRGALSQEELVAFADYFLRCCLDQVQFMEALGFVFPGLWPEAESDWRRSLPSAPSP